MSIAALATKANVAHGTAANDQLLADRRDRLFDLANLVDRRPADPRRDSPGTDESAPSSSMETMNEVPISIEIFRQKREESRVLDLNIEADGSLRFGAQDMGPRVEKTWNREDYEFWVDLPPGTLHKLLAALLREKDSGRSGAALRIFGAYRRSGNLRLGMGPPKSLMASMQYRSIICLAATSQMSGKC